MPKFPDELKERLLKAMARNPEYVEKFGNPLDENDPRNWLPTKRKEAGLSADERLSLLELDVEGMQIVLNTISVWKIEQEKKELVAQIMKDPTGYLKQLTGNPSDTMVQTVDGPIPMEQIPGYSDDPNWTPSPDWIAANCTCPTHTAEREAAKNKSPFPVAKNEDDFPNGLYL